MITFSWQDPVETEKTFVKRILSIVVCENSIYVVILDESDLLVDPSKEPCSIGWLEALSHLHRRARHSTLSFLFLNSNELV